MSEPSTLSRRSRSAGDSQTTYSLGTYVRETEIVLCPSISRASLRASSTGRTSERNTRPKVPSTRSASFVSRFRNTLIDAVMLRAGREDHRRWPALRAGASCAGGHGDDAREQGAGDEAVRRVQQEGLGERLRRRR